MYQIKSIIKNDFKPVSLNKRGK